ncbi:leucine-rich repeat protein [uncultured Ruminococcus sp.]|uniref:leucine-rich repeat protein n=1 Tax=uncultured Ruminococcus sp. TaxID=165186 RepID=UPI0025FAD91D|nr:leucine-rich repeat protein [uncultured Ruminococcus sp.]
MNKKIIAGVAAVLMVASCVPANSSFNFAAVPVITASAAGVEVNGVSISLNKDGSVHLKADDLFEHAGISDSSTELHIDMSDCEEAAASVAGGSLDNVRVVLDAPSISLSKKDVYPNLSHIFFEDSLVTEVGKGFASNCQNLQTVSFGGHIDTLQDNAFSSCGVLQGTSGTTLDLSGIVEIGNGAFNSCGHINNITFTEGLKKVGNNAFNKNSTLTAVDFPTTLEYLGDYAFNGCSLLETITFFGNDTLNNLGKNCFASCEKLTTVTVEGKNYNTLPDGMDSLMCGDSLFANCTSLQTFVWPSRYVLVSESAFSGCTALTSFTFDDIDNSNCGAINSNAFQKCTSLVSIEMPQNCIAIGATAFANCTKLEKVVVSDSLTLVGKGAFASCWVLTLYPHSDTARVKNKVVLPDTWEYIAESTFANCSGLTTVDISPATSIDKSAFEGCFSLKAVDIPEAVTSIKDKTFKGCTALKDVKVSTQLGSIYDYAFQDCTSLETFTPNGVSVEPFTVQFPAALGGVQKYGFNNCSAFKYLNFTDDSQFAVVGENSFAGCKSLLGSSSEGSANDVISMPVRVKEIQKSAFAGDESLTKITFLGDVTTIGQSAFEKCIALEEIVMNDSIEQVSPFAFKNCEALKQMPSTPEGKSAFSHVSTISNSTFENCKAMEKAFIPKNITLIGASAFKNCTGMTKVEWEEGSKLSEIGANAFDGCEQLARFCSSEADSSEVTTFPSNLRKMNDSVFNKTALKEIKIGSPADGSVILMGKNIFSNNTALEKVDMSESNAITVPANAFYQDTNLKTVYLPEKSIVELGESCFYRCSYLHTLGTKKDKEGEYTIPASCTVINNKAFENNFCMQVINFPATSTKLKLSMFNISIKEKDVQENGYTPLERINVDPENTEYMSEDGILYNKEKTALLCRPLYMQGDSFTIPETVTTVDVSACAANSFLKNVYISDNVTTIDDKAFYDCHHLESVEFGNNGTVTLGKSVFTGDNKPIVLYGTAGSTAQAYAEKNKVQTTFVDNAQVAAKLTITDKEGKAITGSYTLAKKKSSYQFKCTQLTADGNEAADTLRWSTSDPEVVTINNSGYANLKGMGTATITVTNANGTAVASISLTVNESGSSGVLGDVNGDGVINITDVGKLAAHVKGVKSLTADEIKRADVSGDGAITVTDVSKLAAHVKGVKKL